MHNAKFLFSMMISSLIIFVLTAYFAVPSYIFSNLFLELYNNYLLYIPLGFIGVWRWSVWIFKRCAGLKYKPISSKIQSSKTLSIISPVYNEDPKIFRSALTSWKKNDPDEVICIIDESDTNCIDVFKDFARDNVHFKLIVTPKPGKREALADGIKIAKGEIVALTDSDTIWGHDIKQNLLAPFEDKEIGGVTARVHPIERSTIWQRMTEIYWNIRNYYDLPSQSVMGKSLSCLSGRTSLYRRHIVLSKLELFLNEMILGKRKESGEDKCFTRLIQMDDWRTYYQDNAIIYSSAAKDFATFCKQRIRWSRNSFNSDLLSLWHGWVWDRHYLAFYMMDRFISTFTIFFGPIFFALALYYKEYLFALSIFFLWIVGRGLKIFPHLRYNPKDAVLIIPFIAVNYLMAVIKLYSLITIREQKYIRERGDNIRNTKEIINKLRNVFATGFVIVFMVYITATLIK